MPKNVKDFTVHIKNRKTRTEEMEDYLTSRFGPSWDKDHENRYWYLGKNYNRPTSESHLEITFYSEWNSKHTLMALEHPFVIINETADEWHKVSDQQFNNLFEEVA